MENNIDLNNNQENNNQRRIILRVNRINNDDNLERFILEINRIDMNILFNNLPSVNILDQPLPQYIMEDSDPDNIFFNNFDELENILKSRYQNKPMLDCFFIDSIIGLNFNNKVNTNILLKSISLEANNLYLNSLKIIDTLFEFSENDLEKILFADFLDNVIISNKAMLFSHNNALNKIINSYNNYNVDIIDTKKSLLSHISSKFLVNRTLPISLVNTIFDEFLSIENPFLLDYYYIHKNLFLFLQTLNINLEKQVVFVENYRDNVDLTTIVNDLDFSKYSDIFFPNNDVDLAFENTIEKFSLNFPNLLNSNIFLNNIESNSEESEIFHNLNLLKTLNSSKYMELIEEQNIDFLNDVEGVYNTVNRNITQNNNPPYGNDELLRAKFKNYQNFFLRKNLLNQGFISNYQNPNNNIIQVVENRGFLLNDLDLQNQNNNLNRNVRQRIN